MFSDTGSAAVVRRVGSDNGTFLTRKREDSANGFMLGMLKIYSGSTVDIIVRRDTKCERLSRKNLTRSGSLAVFDLL